MVPSEAPGQYVPMPSCRRIRAHNLNTTEAYDPFGLSPPRHNRDMRLLQLAGQEHHPSLPYGEGTAAEQAITPPPRLPFDDAQLAKLFLHIQICTAFPPLPRLGDTLHYLALLPYLALPYLACPTLPHVTSRCPALPCLTLPCLARLACRARRARLASLALLALPCPPSSAFLPSLASPSLATADLIRQDSTCMLTNIGLVAMCAGGGACRYDPCARKSKVLQRRVQGHRRGSGSLPTVQRRQSGAVQPALRVVIRRFYKQHVPADFPSSLTGGVRLVLGLCRFDDAFPPLLRRCRQGRYQVGLFRSPTIPSTPPLTASRPHMPAIRA
jgi:hypothetical protein